MRNSVFFCVITMLAFVPSSDQALAGDLAVGSMAEIVANMNHYPSDADKEKLAAIADASEAEIAIATAISNVAHKASTPDRESLTAIAADESLAPELRVLASAVLNINHKASTTDIAKLEKIASGI